MSEQPGAYGWICGMGGWVGLWYGWMGGFVVWVDRDEILPSSLCRNYEVKDKKMKQEEPPVFYFRF